MELRFCLEIIAYRQLQEYGEEIPGEIVGQWKPDQIIKLLASFSPGSDQDCELSVGSHNSSDSIPERWSSGGESKAIPWGVFRKHYQKLGSYLHAPMKKELRNKVVRKDALDKMISDIEHILSSTIILAYKRTINAVCDCGKTIFIGCSQFEDEELVRCGNKACRSLWHKVTLADGEQILKPAKVVVFKCNCSALMPVAVENIWDRFTCGVCNYTYRLNLGYSKVQYL